MGFFNVLKEIGKGALTVAMFVPIPGVPPALQVKAMGLIKAGIAVAEAKGGKGKAETALAVIFPALAAAGINLPVKKVNLLMELVLDEDTTQGQFNFDTAAAGKVAAENQKKSLEDLAALLEAA